MPSPATRSPPLPSSVRDSVVFSGVIVTDTAPAGLAQLMFSASTACFIAPVLAIGESMPNTFWPEHVSEPFAVTRRPDTVLPLSELIGSPPAMIRLRMAHHFNVPSDECSSAASPATCGDAIDVPDRLAYALCR